MKQPRSSGVLLHPTSLPGRYGLGSFGAEARHFVDALAQAHQSFWQVLPLGPTSYGDSPYQSFSAFAGNPLLIDPEILVTEGLLTPADLADVPDFPAEAVDYGWVIPYRTGLLRRAFERLQPGSALEERVLAFRDREAGWLTDYARFMALKDEHGGQAWGEWSPELRGRDPGAIARADERLAEAIAFHAFVQFLFAEQYGALKHYAKERGICLVGDLPIFVAYDSADAWANPDLFYLDSDGHPTVVAGVPPDYFSATGQLWGNPLYRWERHAETGYAWWIARLKKAYELYDLVRIDHFRGFEAYWEVPAEEETAINGRWVKGPGMALFDALRAALGELPVIAEDLGVITPEVEALRDGAGLPGMRILQFAFGGSADNAYLPHNFVPHTVVYTGTHDNDTTRGWFEAAEPEARAHALTYLKGTPETITGDMIRLAMASVANLAVVPMQDWLDLGPEARMNVPGRASGNWAWRMGAKDLSRDLVAQMAELTDLFGRHAKGGRVSAPPAEASLAT